jgi:hypothetical protein
MPGKCIADGLREAIENEDLTRLQSHATLPFLLSARLTIFGQIEGNPGFFCSNPTCEQYAALMNRATILEFLLGLFEESCPPSDEVHQSFENCFSPVSTGTKENLLTLAIHTRPPPLRPGLPQEPPPTDSLEVLLAYISSHSSLVGTLTVDFTRGTQKTALYEAVELQHYRAITLLIEHGANPLLEKGCRHCPLIQSLLQGVDDFDVIWTASEHRVVTLNKKDDTVANHFKLAKWDAETLQMRDDGEQLAYILHTRGNAAEAQRIQDLLGGDVVDAMRVQPVSASGFDPPKCSYPNCFDTYSSRRCDLCSNFFCPNHLHNHKCSAVVETHPTIVSPISIVDEGHCSEPDCDNIELLDMCAKCHRCFCGDHMDSHDCHD